ncbi:MAG TPA: DNA repair protein RecO [Candidatus Baltobacteraceae bacterium]|nr:DNA repair protein RecO [Candidatus Baltobacteraceae bacterium]
MSERAFSTDAIVLRARPIGEADRVFTLLTRERGKLDAVGKGARRPRSAVGARVVPLAEVFVALHKGRSLEVVTEARTIRSYWDGLVRPDALATASLFAETVDLFCEPDLPLPEIYALLRGAIGAVAGAAQPAALIPRFQLRLLNALGLAPADDACVRCGDGFDEHGAWLDLEAGGLGCERCYGARGDAHALQAEDVANFRALGAERGAGASLRATLRVTRAADDLVTWHLGRRPKARALVHELSS